MLSQTNLKKDFLSKKRAGREKTNENDQRKIIPKEEKGKKTLNISLCKSIVASELDFKNPINFIENIWEPSEKSTGIIKVTPPESWKKSNSFIFDNFYFPNFKKSVKKIETRIQSLEGLLKGKVSYILYLFFTFLSFRNFNL